MDADTPALSPLWSPRWDCCLKNWVLLFVGVRPKDTVKPKSRKRRNVLLAGNKENTGDLPQKSVCLAECLTGYMCVREGAQAGEFSTALGQRSTEPKSTSPSLRFTGVGVFTTGVQQLHTILSTRRWCQAKGSVRQNSPDARHKSRWSPALLTNWL